MNKISESTDKYEVQKRGYTSDWRTCASFEEKSNAVRYFNKLVDHQGDLFEIRLQFGDKVLKQSGEANYMSENKTILTFDQLKKLIKEGIADDASDRKQAEKVCQRISRKDRWTYDEIVERLEAAGFKLSEYGGEHQSYAIYTHPSGVVANITYLFKKVPKTKDSWKAAEVTDFWYKFDPKAASY